MQYSWYQNAVVIPLKKFHSGIFVDGCCIPESLLYRNGKKIFHPAIFTNYNIEERIEGNIIFGGYLFNHFGHFILESLSRLWFAKRHPHLPILWLGAQQYSNWQQEIIWLLGIENSACFISKVTAIDGEIAVPEVGYILQTDFREFHNNFLSVIKPSEVCQGKKVWVSRSKFHRGNLINEKRLEERLQSDGWLIYHPQEESVFEQIKFLSSCEHISGLVGSAFHSLILLRELQSKIQLFSRGISTKEYEMNAKRKRFEQTIQYIPYHQVSGAGTSKNIIWNNFSAALNHLSIASLDKIMENPKKSTHSSNRINYIAKHLNLEKYLEIGVFSGDTFFAVDMDSKVAVDPGFRFDYRLHESDKLRFFEITSDLYFTEFCKDEKFDLIFLDGLHTFEQTFRDFCSSLTLAHKHTIWLIDDTIPSDVFSSLPNHQEAIEFRRHAGSSGGQWHGDVFKVVFAIHDFFPTLSYVTISTAGNPQTLVWQSPRKEFNPIINNLESISRLSYFDLQKNISIMNMKPQVEALSVFLKSFSNT